MANSKDDKILELAGKAAPQPWYNSERQQDAIVRDGDDADDPSTLDYYGGSPICESVEINTADYICASANCAPDLVRRIAALRDVLEEVYQQRAGKEAIDAALRADATACAAMKVGDE